MERTALLFLILNLWTTGLALECKLVPGFLKQLDAGNGQVFGVTSSNTVFTLYGGAWTMIRGSLKHVSVGPAGVWGVDSSNFIYRLQNGEWVVVGGLLKQVDAGGSVFAAGVNMYDDIFCGVGWKTLPGKLKYYSCGPYSCWGVNSADQIFIMKDVTSSACGGSLNWEHIPGALSMIEVSTDGKVYGVTSNGDVFTRDGVSPRAPAGTGWRHIPIGRAIKHVSYDLGHLWAIAKDDQILECTE
ncbi:fish-egg lectin-like [Astyanax mexicanus]|uniref:fish-egg lectin-like n=1 Tax=Astyanax mexicanus TaxID=7994 RepID=UPI0020CB5E01|nr:fish-egg lectin-like [Astyanax mexicanus]